MHLHCGCDVTTDNNNTDSDDTSSGELPGWTWGAIGGVVVVTFIAGAFILSRGGGDGEEDAGITDLRQTTEQS